MKLKAIIFDFDGTLANTLPVCFAAFRHAFDKFTGKRFTDEEITALFGPDEAGCIKLVVPNEWEAGYKAYLEEYERVHPEICVEPFSGMLEALESFRQNGVKLGVVTGKSKESAEISLRHLNMESYFDAVRTGSMEGMIKDRLIREMLIEWGISPENAAYVGDAPMDIDAAKTVGVLPIAAAWAETSDYGSLFEKGPAVIFRSVNEFSKWIMGGNL